jgi:hypothetical protein
MDHLWLSVAGPADVVILMTGKFQQGAAAGLFYSQGIRPVFLEGANAMIVGPRRRGWLAPAWRIATISERYPGLRPSSRLAALRPGVTAKSSGPLVMPSPGTNSLLLNNLLNTAIHSH